MTNHAFSWMSRLRRAAIGLAACAVLDSSGSALHAQSSARRDTTLRDSVAAPCDTTPTLRNIHGLQAALYAIAIAPPLVLRIPPAYDRPACAPPPAPEPPGPRLGWWPDHVTVSVAPGYAASSEDPPRARWESVSGAVGVEALRRGYLAEGRFETFRIPERLDYYTVRVGRLWHPDSSLAGGLTIGYRAVSGPRPRQRGVEVAFPLVAGRPSWWVRVETAYVMSLRQSSWSWRLEGDRLLGEGPLFVGARLVVDSWEIRRRGEASHSLAALVLGTTFRAP